MSLLWLHWLCSQYAGLGIGGVLLLTQRTPIPKQKLTMVTMVKVHYKSKFNHKKIVSPGSEWKKWQPFAQTGPHLRLLVVKCACKKFVKNPGLSDPIWFLSRNSTKWTDICQMDIVHLSPVFHFWVFLDGFLTLFICQGIPSVKYTKMLWNSVKG